MDASQLKKLSESYATIAEGGKHEKSAMDWNKKDDNPEGKKVDKKKVDKCTCESFYLKRLKAMNPVMAEKYLAIAAILIDEGYESSRLIDNLVEALPKEIVGEDFRAALHAVNPRIYENLDTAEKRQARATLSEFNLMQKLDDLRRRAGNFLQGKPSGSGGITPEIRKAQEYRDKGGVGVPPELRTNTTPKDTTPKDTTPNASNYSAADAQRDQEAAKAKAQAQRTRPSSPTPTPKTKPQPTGPLTSGGQTTSAGGEAAANARRSTTTNKDGSAMTRSGANTGGLTPMQQWAKNFPKLAAKVKPGATGSKEISALKNSHEPEGELVDESLKQARKNVGASTCWDGYKAKGTKKKNGRDVPNCVKEEETVDEGKGMHRDAKTGEVVDKAEIGKTYYPNFPKKKSSVAIRKEKEKKEKEEREKKKGKLDENLLDKAKSGIKKAAKYGGLGLVGVAANKLDTPDNRKKVKSAIGKAADSGALGLAAAGARALQRNSYEPEGEMVEEKKKGLWDNIHAKRKRGEKPAKPGDKDYPKTLNVEGVMSKDKEDHDTGGFRISDKKAKEARERVKEKTKKKRAEYDNRYSDNTGEESKKKKEALEKKRGMKLDGHPQFTRDDYNIYDIILTYLNENNLMESVEEAEEIMMQLTGAQIVEIIDEFMNDPSFVEQKAYATDGHGNKYRDYNNDGLSDRQKRMKEFGAKRAAMLVKKV